MRLLPKLDEREWDLPTEMPGRKRVDAAIKARWDKSNADVEFYDALNLALRCGLRLVPRQPQSGCITETQVQTWTSDFAAARQHLAHLAPFNPQWPQSEYGQFYMAEMGLKDTPWQHFDPRRLFLEDDSIVETGGLVSKDSWPELYRLLALEARCLPLVQRTPVQRWLVASAVRSQLRGVPDEFDVVAAFRSNHLDAKNIPKGVRIARHVHQPARDDFPGCDYAMVEDLAVWQFVRDTTPQVPDVKKPKRTKPLAGWVKLVADAIADPNAAVWADAAGPHDPWTTPMRLLDDKSPSSKSVITHLARCGLSSESITPGSHVRLYFAPPAQPQERPIDNFNGLAEDILIFAASHKPIWPRPQCDGD